MYIHKAICRLMNRGRTINLHVNILHTLNLCINFYNFCQLSIKQISMYHYSHAASKDMLFYCMIKYIHNSNVCTMYNIIRLWKMNILWIIQVGSIKLDLLFAYIFIIGSFSVNCIYYSEIRIWLVTWSTFL